MTRVGTTTEQTTVVSTLASIADDARAAGMTSPAITVVGQVVAMREALSWFETKPLYGWRVLVPRTKEQSRGLASRLRWYGAVSEEVPTISVEPPRNPQQMDKAVRGLVEGGGVDVGLDVGAVLDLDGLGLVKLVGHWIPVSSAVTRTRRTSPRRTRSPGRRRTPS